MANQDQHCAERSACWAGSRAAALPSLPCLHTVLAQSPLPAPARSVGWWGSSVGAVGPYPEQPPPLCGGPAEELMSSGSEEELKCPVMLGMGA